MISVFQAPSKPFVESFDDTSVSLRTSVNQTGQRNLCKIESVKFTCTGDGKSNTHTSKDLNVKLSSLSPYTTYVCVAQVRNGAAASEVSEFSTQSEESQITTKEGSKLMLKRPTKGLATFFRSSMLSFLEPSEPVHLSLVDDKISPTTCVLQWNKPKSPNGVIKNYNIHVSFESFRYNKFKRCGNDFETEFDDVTLMTNYTYPKALPFSSYQISVRAVNGQTSSSFEHISCETPPG